MKLQYLDEMEGIWPTVLGIAGWTMTNTAKVVAGEHSHLLNWVRNKAGVHSCPIHEDVMHGLGIPSRLDAVSSGLVVVTLNYESYYWFRALFESKRIAREYVILVHGFLPDQGEIRTRLVTDTPWNREQYSTPIPTPFLF